MATINLELDKPDFSEGSPAINSGSIFKSKQVLECGQARDSKTDLLLKIEPELIAFGKNE